MHVLIVEDEVRLAAALARGLQREGMVVDVAHDGHDGYDRYTGATAAPYDVVVLDRDLPGMSGDDLCRVIVAREDRTRVIMVTASGTLEDRVAGLQLGADDYLAKPFEFAELVARMRALHRRSTPAVPAVLVAQDIQLDPARRTVTRGRRRITLTRKEFGLLEALLAARGRVVSTPELLELVWPRNLDPNTSLVRVTMRNLRAKLGVPDVIRTVIGDGYAIDVT